MHKEKMTSGSVDATIVDVKMVFRKALEGQAVSIVACHNHPSGSLRPSQADVDLTRKIKQAGEIIGIALLDHLIISERGYFSFADEGMI
ncbi:MAG: JAB domain-containing protein, partial [Bacteroidota bacterium]